MTLLVRRFFVVSLVALVAAAYPGVAVSDGHDLLPVDPEPDPPNILIIMTDDQRADLTMGVMPKTRSWFADGITFRNGFVTTPVCCPSRGTIFTGRYAHNHRIRTNRHTPALDHGSTIQRYLQDEGYRTAYAGKYLNHWVLEEPPPFFDRFAIMQGGYFDPRVNLDGEVGRGEGYATTYLGEVAREFLGDLAAGSDPWFLFVAPKAPHSPFHPEPAYETAGVGPWTGNPAVRNRRRIGKPGYVRRAKARLNDGRRIRRGQLRMLMSVDDMVDGIFQDLEEMGELDNTLAFFLSDNGFLWGEHGLKGKSHPYLQSVKVPFLARWPERLPSGVRGDLVANVDIAPTIMEAVGITPDPEYPVDGRSLLRSTRRSYLVLERFGGRPWGALVSRRFHYIEHYRPNGRVQFREMYLLRQDPWQRVNRFVERKPPKHPTRQRLRRLTRQGLRCVGTTGPRACP